MDSGYTEYRQIIENDEKEILGQDLYKHRDLQVTAYDNGIIYPHNQDAAVMFGAYTQDGVWIEERSSALNASRFTNQKKVLPEDVSLKYCDYEVVYIGKIWYHYGHFLVDSVSRCWYTGTDNQRYALVGDINFYYPEIPEYIWFFLEGLGIKREAVIEVKEPTRYKRVYVPDQAYDYGCYITEAYKNMFCKVAQNVHLDLEKPEKIYFSRVHFTKAGIVRKRAGKDIVHREYGEKAIEDLFRANGFKILYPEEMDLAQQIHYIKNCKVMAATNGTIAHNILWAKDNTTLIILKKCLDDAGVKHQKAINDMKQIQCFIIDAYAKQGYRGLSLLQMNRCLKKFVRNNKELFQEGIPLRLIFRQVPDHVKFYGRYYIRKVKDWIRHFK